MNRTLLFLSIIILFGCNSKPKQVFPIPSKNDINEILATVLAQDSLFYNKAKRPLSIDLKKIKVYIVDSTKRPPPVLYFSPIEINELIDVNHYNGKLFSHTDSAYLFFQNDTIQTLKISPSILSGFKLTNTVEVTKKSELQEFFPFINITIPLLSLDQKKAYLEINDNCGMCGGGQGILLEKVKGHWKIVKVFITYMT